MAKRRAAGGCKGIPWFIRGYLNVCKSSEDSLVVICISGLTGGVSAKA
jgi:hypothetical protein